MLDSWRRPMLPLFRGKFKRVPRGDRSLSITVKYVNKIRATGTVSKITRETFRGIANLLIRRRYDGRVERF